MFYLQPMKYFTRQQFKDGELLYSWDKRRFSRLMNDGYFEKSYEGNRRLGEHDKYRLTSSALRMLRRIDRILDGREDMPQSVRNKVWNGKKYSDKVLKTAIKNKHGSNTNSNNDISDW